MKSRVIRPLLIVLAVASLGLLTQGAVPDVPTGTWQAGPTLAQPRTGAVAVALEDGGVLLVGGRTAAGPVATTELYDASGTLTVTAPMSIARSGHVAVQLPDGRVLVVGGTTVVATETGTAEVPVSAAEIYDVASNVWYPAGPLAAARSGHTATALSDGRVVVAGGAGDTGPLDSIELFNPEAGTFQPLGILSSPRTEHASAVAGATKVIVAGGRSADAVLNTADIVDVDSGTVASIVLGAARTQASVTALLDGSVLVAGGSNGTTDLATAEVIDPVSGSSTSVGSLSAPRSGHVAVRLPHNNTVLIVGGTGLGAEQYVPWMGQFLQTGSPSLARRGATAEGLGAEGVAILAAGQAADAAPVAPTELFGFATVKTDKDDYAPGTFVTITGKGWQPGETVNLLLHEVGTGAPDTPLNAVADPQGRIFNDFWAPNQSHIGVRFYLTATGSGATAQSTFTDLPRIGSVTIGAQTPSPLYTVPGQASTYLVTPVRTANGTVNGTLSIASVLPAGITASFSPSATWSANGGTAFPARTLSLTTDGTTPPGTYAFTVLAADGTDQATNTSGSLVVALANPTASSVVSNINPSTFGQSITFTATVTSGSGTPTGGTVTFKDGVTTLGSSPLSGGQATFIPSTLFTGAHSITAVYGGQASFAASTSPALTQTVNQSGTTTTVTLTGGTNPSVFGQPLTFTATVLAVAPGAGTRTGTVTFMDGAATLGTGAVNGAGVATLTTATLAAGAHTITAVYGGDTNFTTSTSSGLAHTVNQAITTTTIATDAPDPSVVGQPITVNFAVAVTSPGAGTPTGNVTVTVNDLSGNTCTGTVAAGTCSLTLTTAGAKTLTATYVGNANFATSASSGTSHLVNKANTTTTITSDLPDPSLVGESVAISYSVTVNAPGAGTPTGNVTVSATPGGESCTGTVTAGTCNITFASAGVKTLTASYPNDANFNASTSAGVSHTVQQAPAITSANSTTFTTGAAGSFSVTATGFPAPTFSRTGALPTGVNFSATGVLSGTPAAGTGGAYPITITATNGVSPDATQSFTLTVNQPAAITSANSAAFIVNAAGSFTVTTTGFPTPTLSQSGALPAGVTFNPTNGQLSGTPTVSGSFPITFTATNGVGAPATQNFTLTVGQPPTITSADNTAFTVNSPGTFTATATGFPTPTFSQTGALPSGVSFNSAGVLSGTPALGTVGSYPVTIVASNGIGSNATQSFTLTVNKGNVTFASLTDSQVITYGTPSISLSGKIDGASMLPGTVSITVGGASAGPLPTNGNPNNFGTSLNTSTIPAAPTPYAITYTYSGDANFNSSSDSSTTLTVNKATPTVTVTFAASPITYDGASHAATVTVTGVSGPLSVPSDGTTTTTYLKSGSPSGTPTDAGSYTASATFTSTNPNYNSASSTVDATLTINKATPTVAVAFPASPVTYDGNGHPATATVTGVSGALSVPDDGTTAIAYLKSGAPSGTPTDAGSYTASATFTSTNPNYNNASSATSATLTIDKASSTTTVTFADGPSTAYTGDPHPATATVTGAGGLNQSVTVTYTPGPGAPVDAGSHTAEASFAGDANHESSLGSATLTITKVDPTVTATGNTCTYDGNPCVGAGSATGVKGESLTPVTVAYKDSLGALLTSAPVNAGTYSVAARFAGDQNYNQKQSAPASIVINKATTTTTVTFADGPTTTYTGDPHTATATVTGAGGLNQSVAVTYTPGPGAPVNAGTYSADATFAGDANHETSTGSATLTIAKVDPTVTATGNSCTYDGNACAGSGTATGIKGESLTPVTVAYKDSLGALMTTAPVNAGTYSVAARFAGDQNYNQKQSAPASIVIAKASSATTVTFADGPTTAYTGDPHPATATVTGAGGLNQSIPVTYTPGPGAPVNAGTYSADASFAGDANHESSAGSASLTIARVDPIVTATGNTCTYDGNPCAGSGSATGVKGENLTPVTVAYKDSLGTLLTTPPVNAGTYSVAARFAGDQNYNQKQSTAGPIVIAKASSTTTVTFADGPTTTYTGDPHPATATVTGAGGLNQSIAVAYTPGPGAPVNAGNYTADASFAGDANHEASTGSAPLAIVKADPTVVASGNTCTYDGNPCVGTGSATGVKGESLPVNIAYKDSLGALLTSAPVNAGTYSVAARFAGDLNYNQKQSAPASVVIQKASSTTTVTFADGPTTAYTGDPHPATATVTGAGGLNESLAVTYTPGPGVPINGGSYTADASFPGDQNHEGSGSSATLTIAKVDPVVTATGNTCVYDGNPCGGSASAAGVKGESLPVNIAYKDSLGALLPSAPVNAGTYSIAARFAGDENYNQKQSAPASIVIQKASSTTTVTFADGLTTGYTGDPHPATATVTGVGGLNQSITVTYTPGPGAPVNVGSYSADASFSGDANYEPSTGSASLAITKADPTVTATGNTCTYDGNPCVGSGAATGVKGESLPVHIAYKDSLAALLTSAPLNAGTYNVAARFAGDQNYNQKQSTSATVQISQRNGSVTPNPATKAFGGAEPPLSGTLAGFLAADGVAATYARAAGENVGPYAISATLAPTGVLGNYAITYNTAVFAITPGATTTSLTAPTITLGSNGLVTVAVAGACAPAGNVSLVVDGGTPLTQALAGGSTVFTIATPSVGGHTLSATYAAQGNCAGSGAAGTLTVNNPAPTSQAPVAHNKIVAVTVRPFHDYDDDHDGRGCRYDHDRYDRRRGDGHHWDRHWDNDDDDDDWDREWDRDADEGRGVRVTLTATDADSLKLKFRVITPPAHGVLGRIRKIGCMPNGTGGTTCTARVVYVAEPHYTGADSFTYKANDGTLDSNLATVTINLVPPFATFTQGAWGAYPRGQNAADLLSDNFGAIYGAAGVTVGSSKTLKFTSTSKVRDFLPAGGKAGVLQSTTTNPSSSKGGVLAGHVLALRFNVDFSTAGKTRQGLATMKITRGALKNWIVGDVLARANQVLGGSAAAPAGLSLSDFSDILAKINENYDTGREDKGYLVQP